MQHKHTRHGISRHVRSKPGAVAVAVAVLVVGCGLLLLVDIPAPQQPVEKMLDAKTFLGQ